MRAATAALEAELALWRQQDLTLPLWWRDDDAVAPDAALDRLADLSENLGLPVHLAVIPANATQELADRIAGVNHLVPLVHGWSHTNHAPPAGKKAEFPPHRPLPARLDDAARGRARMVRLFGAPAGRVFVPPWNRIAPDMAAGLAALGFTALSTFGPRAAPITAAGLAQVNTHLDPIDWRGTRSLGDPARLLAQLTRDLAYRRTLRTDAHEPYGLLTHHLVHDAAIWDFTADILARLLSGPARPWAFDTRNAP